MARCPECGTAINLRSFLPFCSERCRCIDLSRWLRGDFVISTPSQENERLPTDPDRAFVDQILEEADHHSGSKAEH
jgi:endogenous inhibitor of DNA gyrase (YacG/DUF329 family)